MNRTVDNDCGLAEQHYHQLVKTEIFILNNGKTEFRKWNSLKRAQDKGLNNVKYEAKSI
jgi:hypothetical protein